MGVVPADMYIMGVGMEINYKFSSGYGSVPDNVRGSPNGVKEVDKVGVQGCGLVLPNAPHEVPELRGGGQLLLVCMCVWAWDEEGS